MRSERGDDLVEQRAVGVPQQRDGALVPHRRPVLAVHGVGAGDELIEQRQGVAWRAAAGPHHQRKHAGFGLHPFLDAELFDVLEHRRGSDQAEGIVVGARADRADDLFGLGGGEDELDVLRRLLDELEQGVEALRGHHVRLVEDEDLEAVARGGEDRALAQIAGVVDTVV